VHGLRHTPVWRALLSPRHGASRPEADKDQKPRPSHGCQSRQGVYTAPVPQVWEVLSKPENMRLWGPFTRPVTGFDRPFAAGDRVTRDRNDFFWHCSQVLLVEKVVPYHSLHLRDLSPGTSRLKVTAIVSVEEAAYREATWIEEAIFYSLGTSRVIQWLDRSLVNPVLQLVAGYGTHKAFRRLWASVE
jgi:uncharacterized protein YndB with AHSA1/START domain